ncbi:MAG: ATP phosphoribosyltransferase [bacterium]|nr:ATP phosphoribosyltransferase [bacterium]
MNQEEKKYQELEKTFVTYSDLCTVVDLDKSADREKFVTLPSSGRELIGRYIFLRDMENTITNISVRESVYKKLRFVDRDLKKINPNWQLVVAYGYRSLEIQKKSFSQQKKILQKKYRNTQDLLEAVHRLIAVPQVAGHPTGGAVDVLIFDQEKKAYLDFGTEIGDFETKDVYTDSPFISQTARKNRQALRQAMLTQGFAPYDGEWWHFSYGDKEWAFFYKKEKYLFDQKSTTAVSFVDKYKNLDKKNLNEKAVRIAIQKKGRLTEETLKLFEQAGLEIEQDTRKLFGHCRNFPVELLYVRDDDIPNLVDAGIVDLGIIGENIFLENKSSSQKIMNLHFGYCSLVLAVPNNSPIKTVRDLRGKRVATTYPIMTDDFFKNMGVDVDLVNISGSVEISPLIGYADAIVDLTATGNSLKQNKLVCVQKILDSQAILVGNLDGLHKDKRAIIDKLVLRFNSSLAARKYKYIMMNAPRQILPKIQDLLPGLKSPTIAQLAGLEDWLSIQTVIEEDVFWETVEKLKKLGATGILVLPIEKLIK